MSAPPIPLLQRFAPDAALGWRAGAPIRVGQFLAAAAALARRLPPGGHCINVCDDRLNFLVGFAACLIARSVTLLPHSRAPRVLREVGASYAGAFRLADSEVAGESGDHIAVGQWPEETELTEVPMIPAGQAAVILFTSGTTGSPSPHAKTWGSLAAGARALAARARDVAGATIVGAVPPQHMWGLETTVMLPLQAGCAVHAACPLLPAEIAAALSDVPAPRWLVATPAHLRACALSSEALPPLAGVLSSTAPLQTETARRIEELGGAAVLEIYGSTETGAIATRRAAETATFTPVDGVDIAIAPDHAVARGGQVETPVRLNDVLLAGAAGCFKVQGRLADVVKIGGSRNSLQALTAELNSVPGVIDGVFWMPDAAAGETRLMAFAVAPGVERSAILAHLRGRIDAAFMPRPLLLTGALPRNAAGKLSRESLRELAASLRRAAPRPSPPEDWQSIAASHPAVAGHFPGNPLVPGAWLLALVERAARRQFGDGFHLTGMPDATFRAPLRPEESFRISFDRVAAGRLSFRIEGKAVLVAEGTLVAEGVP